MNIKSTALVFASLISAYAHSQSSVSHQLEYGVINLDNFAMNKASYEQQFSLLNYKYYFQPLVDNGKPYELQSHMERVSYLHTNLLYNAATNLNISGRYYVNDVYDIEYIIAQASSLNLPSSNSKRDLLSGIQIRKTVADNWNFGAGVLITKDEYTSTHFDISSLSFEYNLKQNTKTELKITSNYQNISNSQGWSIDILLSHESQTKNDDTVTAISVDAQYFSDKSNSTVYKFSVYHDEDIPDESPFITLGISKKKWFTFNRAIDYGLSYVSSSDEENPNILLFDINGTWRF